MRVCEDCCQRFFKDSCLCTGNDVSIKYIGAVTGCIIFTDGFRCKKECNEHGICKDHYNENTTKDKGFMKNLLEKK